MRWDLALLCVCLFVKLKKLSSGATLTIISMPAFFLSVLLFRCLFNLSCPYQQFLRGCGRYLKSCQHSNFFLTKTQVSREFCRQHYFVVAPYFVYFPDQIWFRIIIYDENTSQLSVFLLNIQVLLLIQKLYLGHKKTFPDFKESIFGN